MDRKQEQQPYFNLLKNQQSDIEKLDYSVMDRYKPILQTIADMGGSAISVFDCYKMQHIFYSAGFAKFLGYHGKEFTNREQELLDEKIHPDDFIGLTNNAMLLLKLASELPAQEIMHYKLINEFRILNSDNNYIRVIEQHQALELDYQGRIWLNMSILDISPDQNSKDGLKSQLLNMQTGKTIPFKEYEKSNDSAMAPSLTKRETQVLQMVKEGFLSKEISDKLGISLHTVNTHRQRVLEKLSANNSMEAIAFAGKFDLI